MNAIAALILASTVGVDYGWHRATDGEWEYIIQIEPGLVDTLTKGQALVSQMPPELRGVRRFRIQIGQGEVPREPLPPGGLANANNFADPRANAGGAAGNPLEPAAWGAGGYDFLRQNPIRLDPLENTFLNDPRMRVMESGRDAWDANARPGTASSPWNPLSRPSWNSNASGFPSGAASGAFPPAASAPGAFPAAASGPGTFASGGYGSGFNGGQTADYGGFGIGPDPAPFTGSSRWSGDSPLPERPRLEFDSPADAAESRRLRLNEPAAFPGRTSSGGFSSYAPGSTLGGLPRPTYGQGVTNPGTQGFGPPAFGNQGFGNQPLGNQSFGNQSFGNQSFGNQSFGNQPVGNPPFVAPGLGASGAGVAAMPGQAAFAGSSWDSGRASGAGSRPPAITLAAPGREFGRDGVQATGTDTGGFPSGRGAGAGNVGNSAGDSGRVAATNVSGKRTTARAEISRGSTQPAAFVNSPTDKIWWPLTMTVLLLFGSLGGNFYLGWLAMDFYRRYRECAWQLRTGP